MYTVVSAAISSRTERDEVALTQGQISSHSFGEKSVRQNPEQRAFFEAKDRVGLRTKGLQQFLNAGEILMLEGNLKSLQDTYRKGWGNNSCCNGWFGLVATLLWQVYRWMF